MKSVFVAAILLAAAGLSKADGITGTATGDASFSGSITPTSVSISGYAISDPGGAQVNAGGSLTLYTLGPVRPGFIVFSGSWDGGWGNFGANQAYGSADIAVGDLYENCFAHVWWDCSGALSVPYPFGPNSPSPATLQRTLPFTLGEQYVFSASINGTAPGLYYSPTYVYGDFHGDMSLSYYLTDADGNPVDIYVVPEPGSLWLAGIGMVVLVVAGLRLRHRYTQVGFGNLA